MRGLAGRQAGRFNGAVTMRCLFGHDGEDGIYNAGLIVARCRRCGCDVIRARGGRWYSLPHNYVVRWRAVGRHAAPAWDILRRARHQAPLLHRLRGQRRRRWIWSNYLD